MEYGYPMAVTGIYVTVTGVCGKGNLPESATYYTP